MFRRFVAIAVLLFVISGIGQSSIYGQDSDADLPIPTFGTTVKNNNAAMLRDSMRAMRRHICQKPDPVSKEWQDRFDELLVQMIVNEHRVVWSSLGHLISEDQNELNGKFFVEKENLRKFFRRFAQNNPRFNPVLEKLENGGDRFTPSVSTAQYGNSVFTVYALRVFLFDLHSYVDTEKLNELGSLDDYNATYRRAKASLDTANQKIYQRGIAEANKLAPQKKFPFIVHQPPNRLKQRVAEEIILAFNQAAGLKGVDSKNLLEFEVESLLAVSTVAFDENRQRLVGGVCANPFVDELERYKKEIEDDRKVFAARFEYENIRKTYIEAFEEAGAPDYNDNAGAWSENGFWLAYVEGNDDVGGVIYKVPLRILQNSIDNLRKRRVAYTEADVTYFRNRMEYWRESKAELTPLLNEIIKLDAQRNYDLRAGSLKQISDKDFEARRLARAEKRKELNSAINDIKAAPVFAYTVGEKN